MPIIYDEALKTFYLETSQTSYVFCVQHAGFLQHLYYGKLISREDISDLLPVLRAAPRYDAEGKAFSLDTMPGNEYSTFGLGDYREIALRITYADGSRNNDFKYDSYEILPEKPKLEGLPSLRDGETLLIRMKDGDCELRLYYTVYEQENAIVRHAELQNFGTEQIEINSVMSAELDLWGEDYDAITLGGRYSYERDIVKTPISQGIFSVDSKQGYSSHKTNPFMAIAQKGATEYTGDVYAVNLVYSGSFKASVESTPCGHHDLKMTRMLIGINDFDFSWKLDPGETFTSPEAVYVYSDCGFTKMSQSFHDLYRNYLINPKHVNKHPIVLNSWEGVYFDFDDEKICGLIDKAAMLGVDTFVLDDGWFGNRNDDRTSLGDWYVNENKLKGGLNVLISRCKKQGINFGIWIEPEMISEESELYRAHPDWVIRAGERIYCRERNQCVLDFANPQVVSYIKKVIGDLLENHDISYVKWDMNRPLTEYFSLVLPKDRQKELMHRYVLGVYELAEYLTTRFPDVFFEGCAGGGGRFDPGVLYYFPQIWASDNTDAGAREKIQYGTSLCYPLSAISGHVSVCPCHMNGRTTPIKSRFDIASLCSTGYELNLSELKEEDFAQFRQNVARYKEISDIIYKGDLYRLKSPFESNYFAEIVVSKDKEKAFGVCGIMKIDGLRPAVSIVKFKGLDKTFLYRIKETGKIYRGDILENVGISVGFYSDFATESFTLERVK